MCAAHQILYCSREPLFPENSFVIYLANFWLLPSKRDWRTYFRRRGWELQSMIYNHVFLWGTTEQGRRNYRSSFSFPPLPPPPRTSPPLPSSTPIQPQHETNVLQNTAAEPSPSSGFPCHGNKGKKIIMIREELALIWDWCFDSLLSADYLEKPLAWCQS